MATSKKTAGKTAKDSKSKTKATTLRAWLEESNSRWERDEEEGYLMFSDEELDCVISCYAKGFSGKYGDFAKLYVKLCIDGKTFTMKGDKDSKGKRYPGIKLNDSSTAKLDLEEGEEADVYPEDCAFYSLINTETGESIRRVRILKHID